MSAASSACLTEGSHDDTTTNGPPDFREKRKAVRQDDRPDVQGLWADLVFRRAPVLGVYDVCEAAIETKA